MPANKVGDEIGQALAGQISEISAADKAEVWRKKEE
jgi:hypothetical protein